MKVLAIVVIYTSCPMTIATSSVISSLPQSPTPSLMPTIAPDEPSGDAIGEVVQRNLLPQLIIGLKLEVIIPLAVVASILLVLVLTALTLILYCSWIKLRKDGVYCCFATYIIPECVMYSFTLYCREHSVPFKSCL